MIGSTVLAVIHSHFVPPRPFSPPGPLRFSVGKVEHGLQLPEPPLCANPRHLAFQHFPSPCDCSRGSCEKIRSWFESLTTNGMTPCKFKYMTVPPEALEGRPPIFSQLGCWIGPRCLKLFGFTARCTRHIVPIFRLCVLVSGKGNGYAGKEVAANCAESKTSRRSLDQRESSESRK